MSTELAVVDTDEQIAHDGNEPADPLAILQAALARGTDPAKLEKLMDLSERWKAQRAAEDFAAALNECQKVMPCVIKDRENKFTASRYASLENVNSSIRPVYTQHGFSLSYGTADSRLADHIQVVCDVRHIGGHKERYFLDCPLDGAGMKGSSNKSAAQATGSTISYARRYLMLMIFNVTVADQDLDGGESLDAITEADALGIEDQLTDKQVNRAKFIEWLDNAGICIGEPAVKNIANRHLAKVLDMLNRKKAPGAK